MRYPPTDCVGPLRLAGLSTVCRQVEPASRMIMQIEEAADRLERSSQLGAIAIMSSAQNIYDEPSFFVGYEKLRRMSIGLNEVLEQPALRSMLPVSLEGIRILDLGCGFGDFARKARSEGARAVVGVDISLRMLERAIALTNDPAITYRHSGIEQLELDDGLFDLVVSSLAMHYVEDYRGAVQRIASVLKAGGRLAFSVEHPMCTALPQQQWIRDDRGNPLYWPVDDYNLEGRRETKWFIDGVVKYHRTVETYVTTLIGAGFSLHSLKEPVPIHGASAVSDLNLHRRRPPFLLLAADLKG
jgi:SAM-dependent methyltransferase